VGVNAEIVKPNKNGLIASTPDEWNDALLRLAASPSLRAHLGANARRTIKSDYSAPKSVARFAAVVDMVLS
jgi:glycosyltransferase involved in cell wall biosynthesis